MTAPTIKITDMEEQTPYHVAYIASAEEPATDPDIVAYNECKDIRVKSALLHERGKHCEEAVCAASAIAAVGHGKNTGFSHNLKIILHREALLPRDAKLP